MSVVISTRDRGHYLQTCLESLATQDCPVAFEVVVVDNDSSDNTPQLVREFVERDDRFRYIIEEKVGLSHAKNAGVRASVSSLIVFTDDDVVLDRGWLHSFAKCAERQSNPMFILGGPIHPIPHDLGRWPSWLPNEALRDLPFLDHRATRPLKPFEYLWGANIAAPARVFDELGPWDVELGRSGDLRGTYEDVELVDRVRSSGGTAFFCSDARLHHRVERSTVSPGYVMRRAFSRGTTDHWRAAHGVPAPDHNPPLTSGVGEPFFLVARLCAWLVTTLLFRIRRSRASFARAHYRAWRCGWCLQSITEGNNADAIKKVVRRAALKTRSVASAGAGWRP